MLIGTSLLAEMCAAAPAALQHPSQTDPISQRALLLLLQLLAVPTSR